MSATVDFVDSITLKLEDGENIHLENAYVLTSYASRVAVYCKMREIARNGAADTELEYTFASGIVTGVEPEYCKCEGCVNWPYDGVCALTEHVETY